MDLFRVLGYMQGFGFGMTILAFSDTAHKWWTDPGAQLEKKITEMSQTQKEMSQTQKEMFVMSKEQGKMQAEMFEKLMNLPQETATETAKVVKSP